MLYTNIDLNCAGKKKAISHRNVLVVWNAGGSGLAARLGWSS